MTDLTPGSQWLLPVTMSKGLTFGGYARLLTDRGVPITLSQKELDTLIPADRITELEAEVARLGKLYEDARRAHADEIVSVMYLREELRKMKCP